MSGFDTLTQDELRYICGQISPTAIRQYFSANYAAFTKIKPGFRVEILTDADTRSLLFKNINTRFVSSFVEKTISIWLDEIQNHQKKLIESGYSEEQALLLTIPESVFCDNCELYFKFTDHKPYDEYIHLFREALSLNQKEMSAKKDEENAEAVIQEQALLKEAENHIQELREKLEDSQTAENSLREELKNANSSLEIQKQDIENLKQELSDNKLTISEMQEELTHFQRLNSFSDDDYVPDESSEFQYVSIGQIYHDYNNQLWINRLADVINGEIVPFIPNEKEPRFFGNRDRLFWKDGPDEDGAIGVWSWRADQNYLDPTKDYVTSKYNWYVKVTEIIDFPQCKNLAELVGVITNWFEKSFLSEKVLFTCTTGNGLKEGVLCSINDLEVKGDKAILLASVSMLPQYHINPSDVIKLADTRVYRKMSLGTPQALLRVRNPYHVVKRMLLSRVTVSGLRENELTLKEAKKCKHYIESIPTETLVQELQAEYACTESEAKAYIDGFIEHANTYLTEKDLDLNVISLALARNEELVDVCKKLLTKEWEKEYSDKLAEAEKKLSDTEQDEKKARQETENLLQKNEELAGEIQLIQNRIEKANQLAADVDEKVAKRISEAQQNAADFISQMAFVAPFIGSRKSSEVSSTSYLPVFRNSMPHTAIETIVDDIDTFEEELIDNFISIGYSDEASVEMAQAISFCICNRLPVIVGKNSTALAQCIAATIGGEELTEIFVGNQSTVINNLSSLMGERTADHPLVYLIDGVFDGYNINLFNEISYLVRQSPTNAVVILSIQGIAPNMIPDSIWSGAFYIDGDFGLQKITDASIHAVNLSMAFSRNIDENEYKVKRRELQQFSSVLSNMQMCLYAKYLVSYGISIQDSPVILNQIIAVSRSAGKEEKTGALFHENGISKGEELIERFL